MLPRHGEAMQQRQVLVFGGTTCALAGAGLPRKKAKKAIVDNKAPNNKPVKINFRYVEIPHCTAGEQEMESSAGGEKYQTMK